MAKNSEEYYKDFQHVFNGWLTERWMTECRMGMVAYSCGIVLVVGTEGISGGFDRAINYGWTDD